MVRIRLRRVGAKNKPMYRVVVADRRSPRDGAFIEIIGQYNPLVDPEVFSFDEEKVLKWLKNGAQPSETVSRLLYKAGIMEKFKPGSTPKPVSRKPKSTSKTKSTSEETS
jgi:small subunit ribosomal protein S16